jgi:predicted N-acetyltransferase YhbS
LIVKIRKFETKDAEAVSKVIERAMRVVNSRDYSMEILEPLIEYFSPEKIISLNKERICLVAESNRRIIGTVALEGAELCTFFVHADFQRKGVGISLIGEIEKIAIKNKIATIKLSSSLTAVSFYEKMGYQKNGLDKDGAGGKLIGMEKNLPL